MDLGDAKYRISLDDKATAKMKTLRGSMKSVGTAMAKAGAVMAAAAAAVTIAFGKMMKDWAAAGDEIAKMAKRTGFGVETLSELRHVAEKSGSSIESLEKGVKRMSSTIEDAKDGLETYTRSFDKLGISVQDLEGLSPEEQFWTIANALADVEDATTKAALAQDFFGRAGTDMLPMLAEGTEGIEEMRQEARDLGLVFDDVAAESAEEFTDAMTDMDGAIGGVKKVIVEDLAPAVTDIINEQVIPAIGKFKDWWEANEELRQSLKDMLSDVVTFMEKIPAFIDRLQQIYDIYKKIVDLPGGLGDVFELMTGKAFYDIGKSGEGPTPVTSETGMQWGLPIGSPEWEAQKQWLGEQGLPDFGGGTGGSSVQSVTVNVAGSVVTERDLVDTVRSELIGIGTNNTDTGIQ